MIHGHGSFSPEKVLGLTSRGLRCAFEGMAMVGAEAEALNFEDPNGSQGERVTDYSFVGLAETWDNIPEVRKRLRSKFNLLVHHDPKLQRYSNLKVEQTVWNVRANAAVLTPVVKIVKEQNGLPCIDRLMEQVAKVFNDNSFPVPESLIHSQSWAIRHLISCTKKNSKKTAWHQDS